MKLLLYILIGIVACALAYVIGRSHGLSGKHSYSNPDVRNESLISDREEFEASERLDSDRVEDLDIVVTNRELTGEVAELEVELSRLRKEHERTLVQREILTQPRSHFRKIGFNRNSGDLPRISEETYEFLQLEPDKEERLRAVSEAIVEDLVAWELASVSDIEHDGNSVSVRIPAMTREEADQRLHYRETIRELVHEDDFELLGRTMDEAFSEVFQDRRVTVSIEEKDKRKFYKIERKLYDESGQHRGSLSMSGGTALSERYRHLFGENP